MKKSLTLIIMLLLVITLTGCDLLSGTKTMTCTKTEKDGEGYETVDTMVVTSKSDKLVKVKQTSVIEMDSEDIEMAISMGEEFTKAYNELDGFKMEYKKIDSKKLKLELEIDYSKIDEEKMKETLGGMFDEEDGSMFYKDVSLEKFKTENLEGYTCN